MSTKHPEQALRSIVKASGFPLQIMYPSAAICWDGLPTEGEAAWEGGITYWARLVDETPPDEPTEYTHDYPLHGGSLSLAGVEDPDERWVLDRDALHRGLKVMHELYPQRYTELATGSGDARTADVYVQCCLFGEVVYA